MVNICFSVLLFRSTKPSDLELYSTVLGLFSPVKVCIVQLSTGTQTPYPGRSVNFWVTHNELQTPLPWHQPRFEQCDLSMDRLQSIWWSSHPRQADTHCHYLFWVVAPWCPQLPSPRVHPLEHDRYLLFSGMDQICSSWHKHHTFCTTKSHALCTEANRSGSGFVPRFSFAQDVTLKDCCARTAKCAVCLPRGLQSEG